MCAAIMKYQVHLKVALKLQSRNYQNYHQTMQSPSLALILIKLIQYNVEVTAQQSEDVTASDVKMEDNPAYDTSVL